MLPQCSINWGCATNFIYCILPVNSCDYYKFQVEIGAAANQDLMSKLCIKHKFMIFNLVLCDNYPSAVTI